ncbi:COX15/CtaA family protein [Streptacidiphilus sp. ASG 303]|uniref:COX15/CtaA family protein n=1 Tax=Streptacidiphilus sp. ASG 303 TaxID=2896847 RepID=UPI001E624208|nr:COX15/CtaA family protein [Streptacidiphilus sp. ASG 303]MCD0483124.1 COX15/CtaA family protein [Streptacidiphilus sp. ASG 303]
MRTPLSYLAERLTPTARVVRAACLSALVMSVVIVVTGAAVRLTSSGLGCPTWPRCTAETLAPTQAMGVHGVIEFANRLLTYVLCAAVGAAIVAARCAKPWRRRLTRLGWAQFGIVLSNAVIGGVTVLTGLNPYSVAVHLVASMALIWVALLMWERSREGDGEPEPAVSRPLVQLSYVLVAATTCLVLAGTVVTGAGKHSGDSSDVPRIPLDYDRVTQFHADFAFVTMGLSLAMLFALRAVKAPAPARARARDLLVVLLAQGAVGFVQFFTGSPEVLVGAHLLGSTLVWIAALRIPLALRVRPELPADGGRPGGATPAVRGGGADDSSGLVAAG